MQWPLATAAAALAPLLTGCGGGEPPVPLTIEGAPRLSSALPAIVLTGRTFIPAGSSCPSSREFIVIGAFGEATIRTRNEATGAEGGGFLHTPWVCNSGADDVSWSSHPIGLASGPNTITVNMSDARRSAAATVTVTRSGG